MRAFLKALWVLVAVALPAFAAQQKVQISEVDMLDATQEKGEAPRLRIAADTYNAEIGQNGSLRILSGKIEMMKSVGFAQGVNRRILGSITCEGDIVHLREGRVEKKKAAGLFGDDKAPAGDGVSLEMLPPAEKALPDMPGMDVHFFPDRIEMTMLNLNKGARKMDKENNKWIDAPSFGLSGLLGDGGVAVRNLKSGLEDVLPARYAPWKHEYAAYGFGGHYWPDMDFSYANGSHLEVRGVSGVNFEGQLSNPQGRGFWAIPEVGEKQKFTILIKPPDGKGEIAAAPYFNPRPEAHFSFFFENEPVLYHLDFPGGLVTPGTWQLTWTVADHLLRPVAEGKETLTLKEKDGQTVDVKLNIPEMGWFWVKMDLGPTAGAGRIVKCHREFSLSRIRPEIPSARNEQRWDDLLGERGLRTGTEMGLIWGAAGSPTNGLIDWTKVDLRKCGLVGTNAPDKTTLRGEFAFIGASLPKKLLAPEKAKVSEKDAAIKVVEKDSKEDDLLDALDNEMAKKEKKNEAAKAGVKEEPVLSAAEQLAAQKKKVLHDYVFNLAREGAKIGVNQWEPKNEPNLDTSMDSYIDDYLKVQYPAMKEANPNLNYIAGGVCGMENYWWIRVLFERGAQKYFDGIAIHPYTGLGFQEVFRSSLDSMWQILRDYNREKSGIWLTESCWHRGWGNRPYCTDRWGGWRESHAKHITDLMLNAEAMAVPRDRVYIFYNIDHGYNEMYLISSLGEEQWPLSAAIALQVLNENLRDAKFVKEEPLPWPGRHFQVYRDKDRTVCTAFTAGESSTLDLATDAKEVTVTDIMGNRKVVQPQSGRFTIPMLGDPTYLAVKAGESIKPDYSAMKVQPNVALATIGAKPSSLAGTVNPWTCISGDWTCFESSADKWFGGGQKWLDSLPPGTFPTWFAVKLPQPVAISRVRVCMDYGAWEKPLKDYEVQVFQNNDWKTVATVHSNLNYYSFLEHTFAPVVSDQVRLLIHDVCCNQFEENPGMVPKQPILQALEVYPTAGAPAKALFLTEHPKQRSFGPGGSVNLVFRLLNTTGAKLDGELRLTLPAGMTADKAVQAVSLAPNAEATYTVKVSPVATLADDCFLGVVAGFYQGSELASVDYATRLVHFVPPAKPAPPKVEPKVEKKEAPKPPAPAPAKPATEEKKDNKFIPKDALDVIKDATPPEL